MSFSLKKTYHKIALIFALIVSIFLSFTTFATLFLVRYEVDAQSEIILTKSADSLVSDYQQKVLANKQSVSQNTLDQVYSNIVDQKALASDLSSLASLQKNNQTYTRIVDSTGNVISSSDLFDNYFIDPDIENFRTIESKDVCINYINKKTEALTFQAAQFCPFSGQKQFQLAEKTLILTAVLLLTAYFIGKLIAKKVLTPIEKSANQARQFAQDTYHELMTPITVAMTTADSSFKTKTFEKGITEIRGELKEVYNSLKTLSERNLQQSGKSYEEIDISNLIKNIVKEFENQAQKRNLKFELDNIKSKIFVKADKQAAKLIFKNLVLNAIKYSSENASIKITLNTKEFIIGNIVEDLDFIDEKRVFERSFRSQNARNIEGKGFGLSITKDLCENMGWRINCYKKYANSIIFNIKFNV